MIGASQLLQFHLPLTVLGEGMRLSSGQSYIKSISLPMK